MARENKINIKFILFLTLLGFIGLVVSIPFQMTTLMNSELVSEVDVPIEIGMIITTISQTITLFVLVFIGERCMHRTGLGAPIIHAWLDKKDIPALQKKWVLAAAIVGFVGALFVMLLDHFLFMPNVGVSEEVPIAPWWQGLLAMFYGGFTEELMVRFFAMTFIVWLLAIITRKQRETIPAAYFYIGIVLATLLFGIGHLPTVAQIYGELSALLVVRTVLLNGLLGLWFGYLYWKKGLEYAFIAHMSADVMIHVIFNPLFG